MYFNFRRNILEIFHAKKLTKSKYTVFLQDKILVKSKHLDLSFSQLFKKKTFLVFLNFQYPHVPFFLAKSSSKF